MNFNRRLLRWSQSENLKNNSCTTLHGILQCDTYSHNKFIIPATIYKLSYFSSIEISLGVYLDQMQLLCDIKPTAQILIFLKIFFKWTMLMWIISSTYFEMGLISNDQIEIPNRSLNESNFAPTNTRLFLIRNKETITRTKKKRWRGKTNYSVKNF